MRAKICTDILTVIVTIVLGATAGISAAAKAPMIGFLHHEADRYEAEWRQYTGYYKTLVENGLQGALVDDSPLYKGTLKPGDLYNQLKPFHAVVLYTSGTAIFKMTAEDRQRVEVARADLDRYVREGGGLFVNLKYVRYPGGEDVNYHNLLLEPLGIQILHEGVCDKANLFSSPKTSLFAPMEYFSTANVQSHPIAKDVKRLYLPVHSDGENPGVPAVGLQGPWEVVVAGETTAKSYVVNPADNVMNLEREGTQKSAPPIAVALSHGKGRVFAFNVPRKHTFLNYGNKSWPQITESVGDAATGKPSDGNKLIINALRWISEPATKLAGFGTHRLAPIKQPEFEKTVDFDTRRFSGPAAGVRGITGAHSNHSDGQGTVAEYVAAAKAAGLSFIVFTDPMELMSEEKLAKLKADCTAVSGSDFYACPGLEFTDSLGVRWAVWSEKVVWPPATVKDKNKDFSVWDGKQVFSRGHYEELCNYAPTAIVDYKALRNANAHPANLWWFYRVFPFAYEGDQLIADNVQDYFYALRDLRYLIVDAFTRIRSPQQVALAARTCSTNIKDMKSVHPNLNTRASLQDPMQYVSQGPSIVQWSRINAGLSYPWQTTRGAQRARFRFEVASEAGIAEVKVHDADYGIVRRFVGNGEKTLAREFELVHDKQHYIVLDVVDTQGKRAITSYEFMFCYKSGLYRCGDNCNTLGSAQLLWLPDRNQMPPLVKYFENGFKSTVQGIDSGPPIATQPQLWPMDEIITTQGRYPNTPGTVTNKIPDIKLSSTDLHIYATEIAHLSEGYDTNERPSPALGPVPKRLEPLKLFERSHISYAAAGRTDYFTMWNYRRPWEGTKDYRGSIIWHEGEIRFKEDLTLRGAVPVPLFFTLGPGGAKEGLYDHFYVIDRKKGLVQAVLKPDQKEPFVQEGRIRPGGYCATLNTDLGYFGFFAASGSDFAYSIRGDKNNPSLMGRTTIGLGKDGQQVKAGTVWKYRFALATIADENKNSALLKDMARTYNFDGKRNGYAAAAEVGKIVDMQYFLTAETQDNEAVLSAGPKPMICDLPFRIKGVEDNGCAAIYVYGRNFFRFVGVTDGTAYFQEPIDKGAKLWVGNPFVCENKAVKFTLVIDGQMPDKAPLLEIHNPTDQPLETKVWSPSQTPKLGGTKATVKLPAGDSVFYRIENKKLIKVAAK